MSTRHKKKPDAEETGAGNTARPSDDGSGHARKPFDESMWLRDANGRFAGSVKQSSPFTEQQRIELKDYKEGNYRQLNSYLAKPESVQPSLAHELDKQIKSIDGAIAKSVLTQDTVVYRGIQNTALVTHADRLVGKTMNMKAAYLDQFEVAGNSGENELLFPRDSKIRIMGVDRTRSPPVILGEFE